MKPVLTWPGNKRLLAERIIERLPEHQRYVEPFGGSLAVLLEKERSREEVVNDLNNDLVTFFRCVRFHREALLEELEFVLNARVEFEAFMEQPGFTDLQRAARWFVVNKLSYGGKGENYARGSAASRINRLNALVELSDRLDSVEIERMDWRDLVERNDSPTTCFYLDPPYSIGYQYRALAWSEDDHMQLREVIGKLKGGWVLSYDDSPFIRGLYAEMQIECVDRPNTLGNSNRKNKKASRYRELIITSPVTK